ncbi:terminase gpA endonuclease subunit [Dyella sp.]|uniref:terminase gpA endonuclease subunit n=1 Tax=Dyella sp. TaxID=1869338 RepID=UPI002845731D|nr:terminase gpA endonuclease subunit [Dyella sp.]MDR3446670.1 phage terminase large subunit family protein [Dyella sp.]
MLSKGKLQDVTYRERVDKRGVMIHHVGTVGIKHWLYSRLSLDADKSVEARSCHMSDELSSDYFGGLVSETYNPTKNRFEKRKGAPRNEPLDTWVYAYAAAHHPELRLHRLSKADWDAREARIIGTAAEKKEALKGPSNPQDGGRPNVTREIPPASRPNPFASSDWLNRR